MEDYPRNLAEFERFFATDEVCRDYLMQLRWPAGFRCPRCGGGKFWPQRVILLHCAACDYQSSVIAGTIFQDTHAPLTLWFRAMWYITSQKNGTSALGLQVDHHTPQEIARNAAVRRAATRTAGSCRRRGTPEPHEYSAPIVSNREPVLQCPAPRARPRR